MTRGCALVSGALGGLGTAITGHLLELDYTVIACDRRGDDAAEWLGNFSPTGREKLEFHAFDVRDLAQTLALRDQLTQRGKHISYLINNAGIATAAPPWSMEPQAFDRVIQVNLYGTFNLTRAFCEGMREAGFGRIVNFASLSAVDPGPGMAPYSAAKAGIIGYTHSLAADLARDGVTANTIAPGLIWHDRLRPTFTDEQRAEICATNPMQREGQPREIAATVAFLLSDGAAYINGQTLHVNGGAYMT